MHGDPGSYMSSLRANVDFNNDVAGSFVKSHCVWGAGEHHQHLPGVYQRSHVRRRQRFDDFDGRHRVGLGAAAGLCDYALWGV